MLAEQTTTTAPAMPIGNLLAAAIARYANPAENPIRIYARKVWDECSGKEFPLQIARDCLVEKLLQCNGTEADRKFALSIFDGTVQAQRDRKASGIIKPRRVNKIVTRDNFTGLLETETKPKRTEWVEELDEVAA